MSLASGSSGNCYYLGSEEEGILIDAGMGARSIRKKMRTAGLDFETVRAVLLTHEHCDHIRGIRGLWARHCVPVYGTREVVGAMCRTRYGTGIREEECREVIKNVSFKIGGFRITAFDVPHDSVDHVGYFIENGGVRWMIATDVGKVTETIEDYMGKSTHVVVEANYDTELLLKGSYPEELKARIRGGGGHMSNEETGELIGRCYHGEMRQVWLCHLSGENNEPELAYGAVTSRLLQRGVRVGEIIRVATLNRWEMSEVYELGER
jgi:phosphoribosyl 1,2-cyclic phosphodiesterase